MVGALEYHDRTKHTPSSVRSVPQLDWDNKPIPYKIYTDLPTSSLADSIHPSQIPTLSAITATTGGGRCTQPTLGMLTQLCWLSNGITKTIARRNRRLEFRAAACTGALYHNDLYLVTTDLERLSAGVYHFDPRTLALDQLRAGDYRGVLAEATGHHQRVASAPVSIIVTSTWWRNAWKYRARSYRHAFWDSGTILANLLAVADSLSLPTEIITGFADDQVATLLGITPATEAPLEIVPVGGDAPVPEPLDVAPISPETRALSPNPQSYPLITDAYQASSLPAGDAVRHWRSQDQASASTGEADEKQTVQVLSPVGARQASKAPPYHVIRRRGSCRSFTRASLNWRKVSTILDRAMRGIPFDLSAARPLQWNQAFLIVNDVETIPAGAYRFRPPSENEDGKLVCLREGEFREAAGHLALDQQLAADASVCIFFLADIDHVSNTLGNRGYRLAQLEASVTAGRLYLAAYAHRDLGATGLTFYDDVVTEFFEPHAGGRTPMFLWTLGRPA